MKRWILVMMCAFLYVMPVNATQLSEEESSEVMETEEVVEESSVEESSAEGVEDAEETSSQGEETSLEAASAETEEVVNSTEEMIPVVTEEETEESEVAQIEIPDVTGMTETDAVAALGAVVLPDDLKIEIIKDIKYTDVAEKGIVYEQDVVGLVSVEEAKKVTIFISDGIDLKETVTSGYADPLEQKINSKLGINWEEVPYSYEYNWDNSANCWYNGVWIDQVCYKTAEKEYNTNVRHKVQLYTKDENVYLHVVFSRDYQAKGNGSDYRFYIDREGGNLDNDPKMIAFQVETQDGGQVPFNNLPVGTHQLRLSHRDSSMSYSEVVGGAAYYTVFESRVNAHLEMKIPLAEMKAQNPNIDIENIGTIEVFNPNLMYRSITTSGASTFPFATAAAAFVLVPGSAYVINKKRKLTKKDSNEK